jgi:hypothetical protein
MTWQPNAATVRLQQIKAKKYRSKDSPTAKPADEPEKEETPAKEKALPKPAKKAIKKKIKPRTKKKAKENRDLAITYGPYLEKHPVCAIQSPVCTHIATCVNHTAGRGIHEVLNQATWEPSCTPCNGYIETHDQWARENGHKISRLANKNK